MVNASARVTRCLLGAFDTLCARARARARACARARAWGRFWIDFDEVLEACGERIWMLLARLGADSKLLLDVLFVATFRTGTPSLLRYAPRSVTIRGGSLTPSRVKPR